MADDDDRSPPAEASSSSTESSSTAHQTDDRSQILAQATRFLTSANISESASEQDKREFLRSKGLTEDEIARAFQDSTSPATRLASQPSSSSYMDPFELAARQFDDPINADALVPPPKSYPNSPLALYYDPPTTGSTQPALAQSGQQPSPLTRYQVLLQFFRTLSYMMMLSGGLTAILVSSYRAYILPKITAMFDARSIVLKHHIVLFDRLRSSVAGLATYVPVQHARVDDAASAASAGSSPLKGVLKKVHFNDEVDSTEKEGVKSTQNTSGEKVVMPSTDVVVDAKTPLLSEGGSEDGSTGEGEEVEEVRKIEPIDLMVPIRESLTRLAEVMKGDLAGRSTPSAVESRSSTNTSRRAKVTSVTDAGSGSDSWEDDSSTASADEDDDDDGLEFDPYGAYQKKHKHTQTSSSQTPSSSTSIANLKSTLVSLNADISTHAYAATSASYSGGGSAFRFAGSTDAAGSGTESPKSGDLGQVKAEIRSLKGLLLSRRNFPSYGAVRPPPLPASAERGGSAVV
ncbi:Pex14_N domain-containing protein [Pseudozyma hubeiensis]|nr:Pex14_N domain-containing protein [Pseudozyma hubeiensis]